MSPLGTPLSSRGFPRSSAAGARAAQAPADTTYVVAGRLVADDSPEPVALANVLLVGAEDSVSANADLGTLTLAAFAKTLETAVVTARKQLASGAHAPLAR